MSFADRLKELRIKKDMTQGELSKALNISQSAIAMYESGKREPKIEILEVFADFFNVDMNYITGKSDLTTNLGQSTPSYYADPETAEVAERLRTQPGMRMLFDASKNAKPEDLQYAADLLKRLKGDEE
ncbi:helix-turn-helix domain-containing protein [uncultured Anaerovibrio sp.]|uniref:helix-turn-helix domain-containing protein n=1 Tax=uncultured Anaerovibrio sp. TaxID=361586 RepID=UPI00262A7A64|nr:helix-turn-helix transcriptional regulator [uncultured Anaerovibrio sp.]